jgi:hypothetical protein
MSDKLIALECPKCGLEKSAPLDPTDPPGTARIKTLCPECAGGDFSLVDYFDKGGKQLMADPHGTESSHTMNNSTFQEK